jgi:hypothetical protein
MKQETREKDTQREERRKAKANEKNHKIASSLIQPKRGWSFQHTS